MDEVEPGDEITLEMPYATFTYEVQKVDIVDPSEIDVVRNVGYERLVLSACHPLYSAAQRIITFAKLKEISLFGSGTRIWQDSLRELSLACSLERRPCGSDRQSGLSRAMARRANRARLHLGATMTLTASITRVAYRSLKASSPSNMS